MNSSNEYSQYELSGADEDRVCQRAHKRHDWNRKVTVSWLRNGSPTEPVELMTSDLSQGGVGLISAVMVLEGTIGVVLMVDAKGESILRCVEVRYCQCLGYGRHILGCQWTRMPRDLPVRVDKGEQGPRLTV